MQKDELVDEVRQMIHYCQTQTTASHADGPVRNPARNYSDPEQFELEKEHIFRRYPNDLRVQVEPRLRTLGMKVVGEPGDPIGLAAVRELLATKSRAFRLPRKASRP